VSLALLGFLVAQATIFLITSVRTGERVPSRTGLAEAVGSTPRHLRRAGGHSLCAAPGRAPAARKATTPNWREIHRLTAGLHKRYVETAARQQP
jgi:hypothetical protein